MDKRNQAGAGRPAGIWRIPFLVLMGVAVVVCAFYEILVDMPLPLYVYGIAGIVATLAAVRLGPLRKQAAHLTGLAVILAMLATLYCVPWSSRKPFLRNLRKVKRGMSEAEVRRIMHGYIEGTGWPNMPGDVRGSSGTLQDMGTGGGFAVEVRGDEMALKDAIVFRHSNTPEYNSDWGIVTMKDGRVTRVDFSPD